MVLRGAEETINEDAEDSCAFGQGQSVSLGGIMSMRGQQGRTFTLPRGGRRGRLGMSPENQEFLSEAAKAPPSA